LKASARPGLSFARRCGPAVSALVMTALRGIMASSGARAAAKSLGISEVPAVEVRGLSAAKKRALALADNKIAENAGWDREILALELQDLYSQGDMLGRVVALLKGSRS
jgi:hypothetical protein